MHKLFLCVCSSQNGRVKRRQWKAQDMERAMEAAKSGKTVSTAAKLHSVPRKTLDDRVKGRVEHGTNPGPPTALTATEEGALISYLLYMADRGFPLTTTMAQAFAWAIAIRSGTQARLNAESGPGKHWWLNFRRRHPELSLCTAD